MDMNSFWFDLTAYIGLTVYTRTYLRSSEWILANLMGTSPEFSFNIVVLKYFAGWKCPIDTFMLRWVLFYYQCDVNTV